MDVLFDQNFIVLRANPQYYDYLHELRLKYDEYEFKLLDGGCQRMDNIYKGYFDYDDEYLTLYFENSEGLTPTTTTIEHKIKYTIIEEDTKHFNGYGMEVSKFTIKFDKSPFSFDSKVKYHETHFPLTFYSGISSIECNIKLENLRHNRNNFLKDLTVELENSENSENEDGENSVTKDICHFCEKIHRETVKINSVVNDEILIKIIDMHKKFFDIKNTPLKYTDWITCYDNKIVLRNNDRYPFMLVISNDTIEFHQIEFNKSTRKIDHVIKEYKFPENYDSIVKEILSYGGKNETNFNSLYENLQEFRVETLKLFN